MNIPMMAGTLSPEQMAQQQQHQAMVDALRNMQGSQQFSPQRAGQVVSAGALGDGMDTSAIGSALRKGGSWLGGNLSAANTYGTNPFSEQTGMLAAQDAAFL